MWVGGDESARPVRRMHGVAAQDWRGEPRSQGGHIYGYELQQGGCHANRLLAMTAAEHDHDVTTASM